MAGGFVLFCGSRGLAGAGFSALVGRVVASVLASGRAVRVGCCLGADAAVLSAVLQQGGASRLSVFSAFGPGGQGACSLSAVSLVASCAAAGVSVRWWAGGGPRVPLRARLVARSVALSSSPLAGVVAFFASPGSAGTWLACSRAASAGIRVVAFSVGFVGAPAPLGAGAWVPSGLSGVWSLAWRWVPAP